MGKSIEIEKTDSSPEIIWINNVFTIKGRSIPEDCHSFYKPIIDLMKELSCENLKLNFYMEYVNTSSSLTLLNLLRTIEENEKVESIDLNWYYEDDDLDMLEMGEMYSEKLSRIEFEYLECMDITA